MAGLFILFVHVPLEGFTAFIVIATGILAVLVVVGVFIVGSPEGTRRAGELTNPAWRLSHRLARKPAPDRDFGLFLTENRQIAADHLRDEWFPTSGATILTLVTKCSLLVIALRDGDFSRGATIGFTGTTQLGPADTRHPSAHTALETADGPALPRRRDLREPVHADVP